VDQIEARLGSPNHPESRLDTTVTVLTISSLTLRCIPNRDTWSGRSMLSLALKRDGQVVPKPNETNDMSFGDPQSARRLTQVIAAIHSQSAHVVGITGARQGVGVSVTSRQLAGALANFGTKTLLVDISRADLLETDALPSTFAPSAAVLDNVNEVRPSLSFADLAEAQLSTDQLREAFTTATETGHTIVVDLPPVTLRTGQPSPAFMAAGRACDLVFLVCLSGEMRRQELTECIETCRIVDIKLGGLILNDWRLPGNRWLD
jgi:Mrp family chromosome partitioning ATPase